jgi:hypothetical protein
MLNWDYQDWIPSDRLVPRAPEPKPDGWEKCSQEIRCIWPDQLMTKPFTLTGEMYVHHFGWYHGLMIYQGMDGNIEAVLTNRL